VSAARPNVDRRLEAAVHRSRRCDIGDESGELPCGAIRERQKIEILGSVVPRLDEAGQRIVGALAARQEAHRHGQLALSPNADDVAVIAGVLRSRLDRVAGKRWRRDVAELGNFRTVPRDESAMCGYGIALETCGNTRHLSLLRPANQAGVSPPRSKQSLARLRFVTRSSTNGTVLD